MNADLVIDDLHPLLERLLQLTGAARLEAEALPAWAAAPGTAMLVFCEEPDHYKETLDIAVIVPELHAARPGAFRVGSAFLRRTKVVERARQPMDALMRETGETANLGIEVKDEQDTVPFHPYYTAKDGFGVGVFLLLFVTLTFFSPNLLGHADNYIAANPLSTPAHIVPEWYFWPFYAILRAFTFNFLWIDAKLWGVIAMFAAIWMFLSPERSPAPVGYIPPPAPVDEGMSGGVWVLVATVGFVGLVGDFVVHRHGHEDLVIHRVQLTHRHGRDRASTVPAWTRAHRPCDVSGSAPVVAPVGAGGWPAGCSASRFSPRPCSPCSSRPGPRLPMATSSSSRPTT